MTTPDSIRTALNRRPPRLAERTSRRRAAVAMLLREGSSGLEVLFIRRAEHEADPWSGNLAFPGGKIDENDGEPLQAAIRETSEEIGVDLTDADLLGRLDDIAGAALPVIVSCFVFLVPISPILCLNEEVREAFWFPLAELASLRRHHTARIDWYGSVHTTPGIDLLGDRGPVLWGITYRLVMQFLDRIGLLPPEAAEPHS